MKKFALGLFVGLLLATATTVYAAQGFAGVFAQFNLVVDGKAVILDKDPAVIDGSTYLPVRALATLLGYRVDYNANTRTITLTSQPAEPTTPEPEGKIAAEYWAAVETEIVTLCNQERAKAGLGPLQHNATLREMARFKSNDMLQHDYFDHVSPVTGWGLGDLAREFDYAYTALGENIWMTASSSSDPRWAEQFKAGVTAKRIVDAWMNSPGHKANILSFKFSRIGVGVVYGSNLKVYATQEFSN